MRRRFRFHTIKKLLIIDDDDDILELMKHVMEDTGFQLITSRKTMTVQEIVDLKPNLILIDYILADGTGDQVSRAIKEDPRAKHIPVLFFSALTNLEELAHKSKADSFIEKPFEIHELKEKIKSMAL